MKFSDFMKETKKDVARFERWWVRSCKENPEYFTLDIPDDNAGQFFESFVEFMSTPDLFDPPTSGAP